ncbi:MAG: hypothetical protein HDS38_05395 [Bacteroides sp.]|nr:hypothetical protein [Bacteroides sp.]
MDQTPVEFYKRLQHIGYEASYEEWKQHIAQISDKQYKHCGYGKPDDELHDPVYVPEVLCFLY